MRARTLLSVTAVSLLALTGCSEDPDPRTEYQPTDPASATSAAPSSSPSEEASESESPSESASPSEDASASQSPSSSESSESSESDAASAAPVEFSADMAWSGGMMMEARVEGDEANIVGWVPGMEEAVRCRVPLWEDDEIDDGTPVASAVLVAAPREDAADGVTVIYPTETVSSGTDAAEKHLYAQSLTLDGCSLGDRVDLGGGPLDEEWDHTTPELLAVGEQGLAVELALDVTMAPKAAVIGFSPSEQKVAWTLSGASDEYQVEQLPGLSAFTAGHPDEETRVIDPDSGESIASYDDTIDDPAVTLGEDLHLLTRAPISGDKEQEIIDAGTAHSLGSTLFEADGVVMDDGEGNQIYVGLYCTLEDGRCSDEGQALGYVGADGTVHEVLPAAEVESLDLTLLGGTSGTIYVDTTNEGLVLDLTGETVGEPVDDAHESFPAGDRVIDGSAWTTWREDAGFGGTEVAPAGQTLDES